MFREFLSFFPVFVSFKAAKQRNVPVFLKTENNEDFVAEKLK
jgi:hypothetical protein